MTAHRPPRIGVVFYRDQGFGRQVVSGALQFASANGSGIARMVHPGSPRQTDLRDQLGGLDGVICVMDHNEFGRLDTVTTPRVCVPQLSAEHDELTVAANTSVVAQMAVEHLALMRVPCVSVVLYHDRHGYRALAAQVERASADHGLAYVPGPDALGAAGMVDLIDRLPIPAALMCQNVSQAKRMLGFARQRGRRVPEELAVVTIGDDFIEEMFADPPLTSVVLPAERIGERAMELLHHRLEGRAVRSVEVRPTGVAERGSTGMVASGDRAVNEALQYIHRHYAERIDTQAVAGHVGLAKRTIEKRFAAAVGRGVHEEIVRCRLERAKAMLAHTELSIKEIAFGVGFVRQSHFSRFIREHTGGSPTTYRHRSRRLY